ncbi:MAG: hypothetical protein EBU46_18380 [Nitrosomonadaceae bacterium]|nr:hypothetical protein [Nitrosomonadaceae bacterium]
MQSAFILQVSFVGPQNDPAPTDAGLQNLLFAFCAQSASAEQADAGLIASTHNPLWYSVWTMLGTCGIGARPAGRAATVNALREDGFKFNKAIKAKVARISATSTANAASMV